MSIIRSNIARQLLAEGGAPRKPFSNGGFDYEGDAYGTTSMSDYESGTAGDPMGEAAGTSDMFSGGGGSPFIEASEVALTSGPRGRQDLDSQFDSMQGFKKPNIGILQNLRDNAGDIVLGAIAPQFLLAKKAAEKFGLIDPNYVPDPNRFNREDDDDSDPIILPKLRAPITEAKEEPKNEFDELLKFYGARFEDGGEVREGYKLGDIVGGIGKVFGKATDAAKKVFKSPIGRAALFATPFLFPSVRTAGIGAARAGKNKFLDFVLGKQFVDTGGEVFRSGGINPLMAILGLSALSGLTAKQTEEEDENDVQTVKSDPAFQKLLAYYGGPRRFAAEGGMMEQDEMLDLGGKEMDLRGGGFVPLGEYEKKDDVPARLSKNEFVFTADAVRAAGGGSVDKGADVMYKTMKTLENKVA